MKDNNSKIMQPWEYCGSTECNVEEGGDLLSGFPWPPRSYTCSFCKRQFISAQALGGHMNVHRRDRARLRQSPPRDHGKCTTFLNLNVEPNPNPSFSSSSPSSSPLTKFPPFTSKLPSSLSPPLSAISSPSSASAIELKRWENNGLLCNNPLSMTSADQLTKKTTKANFGVEDLGSLKCEKGCTIMKKTDNIVTLDLEIGLKFNETKQDLDLELRLGYT